jgi:hypothetical protein
MLIYKNVKDDKCGVESSMRECNKALNPDNDENFLKFERCVNLTFKEYDEKDYMNDNIFCEEFETTIDNIKIEIKNRITGIQRVYTLGDKLPLPIYVMIAKVIEHDPNNEAANIINNFINEITNTSVKNKIQKNLNKLKKTSLVKYTFQGNYKIVIYIPNLMKIKKGEHMNKYSFFPSLESVSQQNKWMNLIVSKKSMYFRAVKQNSDYINEKIENIGKDEYWSSSQSKRNEYLAEADVKNKTNWKNDLLYYELEKTCLNMGCVSDVGEDLEELVPKYSKKSEDMNKNSLNHTPYYPSKCFQTKNYKNYMFDDSGEGGEEKKREFIEKAIKFMSEKLESDENGGTFDTLLKTSVSAARNEIYNTSGKKPFEFSKDFNNNILKDFARRNNNFPGVPEMSFRLYRLNETNSEFKKIVHYMPWGKECELLTQEYILNEGEVIRMDDVTVDKKTLNTKVNQMALKSFNDTFKIKINNSNGKLSVYKNNNNIGVLRGTNNINLKDYNNRTLKCELNNIHLYGEDIHGQNDNRGTLQLTIKDEKAKIPCSIIVDPKTGFLVMYDLGFNVVN